MISQRSKNIPPFLVMEVLEKAKELEKAGHDIIHLEVGEPDFDTPLKIKQAAQQAIVENHSHYTHSLGLLELREAVCAHYFKKYSVSVSPDQVIITQGTSPALYLLMSALLNPGDEIILTDPGYACYPNFIEFAGGIPQYAKLEPKTGFELNIDSIREKITQKTRALFINSPSNPTGMMLGKNHLEQISELGIPIISDEIYHGLSYGKKEHSILEFTDKAFVLNGFSKYYAMTGYRLGYIIAPPEYVRPMQKIQQNLFICASSIAQHAGVCALNETHPELGEMVKTYDERRQFLYKKLTGLGLDVYAEPQGAFYMLADARHFSKDSYKLAFEILEKAHVAVTPGIDFGQNAEGFIRFSYANSLENIKIGMERLGDFLKNY